MNLSVIVPLAPFEELNKSFIMDLRLLPAGTEILFVSAEFSNCDIVKSGIPGFKVRHITAGNGRARCLNAGALNSSGDYLWFIHADSRFDRHTVPSLLAAIKLYPDVLLYFDLVFDDASILMKLNEWGVYFRTRFLGTPFGDQGFCVRKDLYNLTGGFPEDAIYGEDHLFIRNVRRNHVHIKPVKAVLYTSARKYRKNGWFRTTIMHLYLWQKQIYYDNRKHRGKKTG